MRIVYSLLILAMISSCGLSSTVKAGDITDQPKKSHEHLVGEIDKSALLEPPYRSWYEKNFNGYFPNKNTIEALTTSLNDVRVKGFMGTWCHDSQREVPRLYKILESSGIDLSSVNLVALNHDKKTSNGLEEGLNIQRTPTFIFFKNGVEIGRIVERPRDSLENDILKIVSGLEYKHSYQQ